jgi:hypothetical protein
MTDTDKKIEEACVEMLSELGLDEPPYCADILKLMRFAKEQRAEALEEAADLAEKFGDWAYVVARIYARAREIKEDEE